MNIIGVKFQSKNNPSEYVGREYSYFVADGIDLNIGDIVPVTTKNGEGLAMVTRTGIEESEINDHVKPFMRTIENKPIAPEPEKVQENEPLELSEADNFFEED